MSSIKLTVLMTDALFHTLFQAVTLLYAVPSLMTFLHVLRMMEVGGVVKT